MHISMDTLARICETLDYGITDVIELASDEPSVTGGNANEGTESQKPLSSSDKRWLLYWNFINCIGVSSFFLIVTGIVTVRVTRQNGRDVEEAMNMIATYMATATKDEYDDIAATIRHDLIFSEYGEDIANLIQYIPNTADDCRTCMESYSAMIHKILIQSLWLLSLLP